MDLLHDVGVALGTILDLVLDPVRKFAQHAVHGPLAHLPGLQQLVHSHRLLLHAELEARLPGLPLQPVPRQRLLEQADLLKPGQALTGTVTSIDHLARGLCEPGANDVLPFLALLAFVLKHNIAAREATVQLGEGLFASFLLVLQQRLQLRQFGRQVLIVPRDDLLVRLLALAALLLQRLLYAARQVLAQRDLPLQSAARRFAVVRGVALDLLARESLFAETRL
mmetsp:Transcript_2975/g.11427  ORF Transcript_2975/g.11427 Transcript_2975/m.11427 type:complete len:224 (-) Transcript_2975:1745-2416(-)